MKHALTPIYKKNLVAFVVMHGYKHDKVIPASHSCIPTKYAQRCFILCRSDEFRNSFALLSELRSIIPDRVNILATTATATKDTLLAVKKEVVYVRSHYYSPST